MPTHMFTVTATKKSMALFVSRHCTKCMSKQAKRFCTSKDCDLYPIRIMRTVEPDQTHMFKSADFPAFVRDVVQAAIEYSSVVSDGFGFDQLRGAVPIQPMHPNWWGNVTRTRAWKANFEATGAHQVSETDSRAGGMQLVWRRKRYSPEMLACTRAMCEGALAPDVVSALANT